MKSSFCVFGPAYAKLAAGRRISTYGSESHLVNVKDRIRVYRALYPDPWSGCAIAFRLNEFLTCRVLNKIKFTSRDEATKTHILLEAIIKRPPVVLDSMYYDVITWEQIRSGSVSIVLPAHTYHDLQDHSFIKVTTARELHIPDGNIVNLRYSHSISPMSETHTIFSTPLQQKAMFNGLHSITSVRDWTIREYEFIPVPGHSDW